MHHNFDRLLTVYVENLFGDERLTVRISEDATVEDLRSTVVDPGKSSSPGGGGDNQIFLYNDTPLSDETRTLKSYDVEDGAVLTIVPHMKTGPRRRDVDRAAIRRATQSIQREAVELMKYVTVTNDGKTSANPTTEDDEIYAVESTPDKRLRLVKYGPKKTIQAKKSEDEENEKTEEDEHAKNLRQKMNIIRQKIKKRSSTSSTKSEKSPTTSSKKADELATKKLEKEDTGSNANGQKTKEIKAPTSCKEKDNSSREKKEEEQQHEL